MKSRILFTTFVAAILLAGCRGRNKDAYVAPVELFTGADTAAVLSLVNQYVDCLNNQDYDGMVDLLRYMDDNRIYSYDESQRDSVKRGLQQIPIYAAKLYSFSLNGNSNNKVGLLVQLIEDGSLEEEIGVSKLYLAPVQIGDEWYLTLPSR